MAGRRSGLWVLTLAPDPQMQSDLFLAKQKKPRSRQLRKPLVVQVRHAPTQQAQVYPAGSGGSGTPSRLRGFRYTQQAQGHPAGSGTPSRLRGFRDSEQAPGVQGVQGH